jgi:alcohol dehydrogenase class IV
VLDPLLTLSQPPAVRAAAGYDALSHAVESYVTTNEPKPPSCSPARPGACCTKATPPRFARIERQPPARRLVRRLRH